MVSFEDGPPLPETLGLAGAKLSADNLGHSDAQVWHVRWPDGREAYLKAQPELGSAAERQLGPTVSLARDRELLGWLKGRVPVPEVLGFASEGGMEYLLMSVVPGQPASDGEFLLVPEQTLPLLAQALKQLHALPIADCPFEIGLAQKLTLARQHLEQGLVDAQGFQEIFQGLSAVELYAHLQAALPQQPEDLVFTHGDACLPNFLIAAGRFQGFIDLGYAGVADRWQDLALLVRSLYRNGYTAEHARLCLASYGTELNQEKLDFYLLLDEFF